jgi:cyclic-di-GMP-binding protein
MPSFDAVSEVDMQEVQNAMNQAQKEIQTRFDFRDAKAEIILEKTEIKISAIDAYKLKALQEIVLGKLARRNVSLKNIDSQEPDISPVGHARQLLKIKQGLETENAKKVIAKIKETGLKVQTQIQDSQVRVTGKDRDDLQSVIAALRATEFPFTLNFTNFRN